MIASTNNHEILTIFEAHGLPLCDSIVDMLNEHYSHCTERRGSGFTQASRVLAANINIPRQQSDMEDLRVFADPPIRQLEWLLGQAGSQGMILAGWRNLDLQAHVQARLKLPTGNADFDNELAEQVRIQRSLRGMIDHLEREESRLLVQMLIDLILPRTPLQEGLASLTAATIKPKIGSCTLAEKFFLEIIHDSIPRKGRVNIVVDDQGQPVLLEKLNMGDSHSCISLAPVMMNGVRIPPGSLFAAQVDDDNPPVPLRSCRKLKGYIIPLAHYDGFRFLRLTTLAVTPANRARAFGAHFTRQADTGMFGYATAKMDEFVMLARNQL